MINNVAFTGREAMLGKPVRNTTAVVAEQLNKAYTGIGKNFSKAEIANAKELAAEARFINNSSTMADRIASYKASHQPIEFAVQPAPNTGNVEHIDFFA